MATVCFVTCLRWPEIAASDRLAANALACRGVTVVGQPWNAPDSVFDRHDAVILRSNWDYHLAPDDFLAWLGRWEAARINLWNPPALVRWNISKRYLLDLEAAGVAVVPTIVTDAASVPGILDARGWHEAVIKPAVGASAHGTVVIHRSEARTLARDVGADANGGELLVQPFIEEIRTAGEWSLVFIDGAMTHAVLKRPAAGDFRVQPRFGGSVELATPPAVVLAAAQEAVAALPLEPLYARIDGVVTGDGFLVMEAEVNEPGLFFLVSPAAAEAFATAIRRRL
jgi:glutathione synthase/RimK-type ligase-like ATP-grasp enzyme